MTPEHIGRHQPLADADLLARQDALPAEARAVLADLDLVRLLEPVGRPVVVGSATLGLMAWRDIDFNVMCDELDIDRIFTAVRPLAANPGIYRLRFANEHGPFNSTGRPEDDGYYWGVHYFTGGTLAGDRWKIDVWFLPEGSPRPEFILIERCRRELTPETRLAILRVKNAWYEQPAYRHTVLSVDIYDAVLDHGVRIPAEFTAYLAERGKEPG